MKTYKSLILYLTLFIIIAAPCTSWTAESASDALKRIIKDIEQTIISKKEKIHQRTPPIIAIGGCPGVGKSTLARLLQTELNKVKINSVVISLDHYGLSQVERKQFKSELDPRRIRWDKIHETLQSICEGQKKITKPVIDQLTKERGEETLDLEQIDCILFEGSYALGDFSPIDFRQYMDIAIYLEASLENIYDWKWQRELKKDKPRKPEEFFHHMTEILRDFAFHVYPTKKNAQYLIQADCFHCYSVLEYKNIEERPEPDFTALRLETLIY